MTTEPRLTTAFTGVDKFRAAWHHGKPGALTSASAADLSPHSATVPGSAANGAVLDPLTSRGARSSGKSTKRVSTAPTSAAPGPDRPGVAASPTAEGAKA